MSEQFTPEEARGDREPIVLGELQPLDMDYFYELEGADGWIAFGDEYYRNQRYFTVVDDKGKKLGVVGVYDTDDDNNITHTVVDPEYRGQSLATKMKLKLADSLGLNAMTMTVDLDNESSLRSVEKMPDTERVSNEVYEQENHKAKFEWKRPKEE